MKLLIFILLITFCLADPSFRGLQAPDPHFIISDAASRRLQEELSISNEDIANTLFAVLNISVSSTQVVGDGTEYFGTLLFHNSNNVVVLANISVLIRAAARQVVITAFNYAIITPVKPSNPSNETNSTNSTSGNNGTNTTNNTSPDGYTLLDPSYVQDTPEAYNAVVYGVNAVLQIGINQTKIPNTRYNITEVVSVSQRNRTRGTNYRVIANLINENYVHVYTNLTIYYVWSTQTYTLVSYYYHATNITNVNNNSTSSPGNTTTNSTSNTTNNTTSDGYTILTENQVEQNSKISGALLYGLNAVIQLGVSQNKVPNTLYNLTDLQFAGYKNQSRGVSYKFSTKSINSKYVHLDANMTVYYNNTSQSYRLTSYYYHSYNYTKSMLPNATNNSSSNGTNTTVPNNSTNSTGNTGSSGNNSTNSTGSSGSNNTNSTGNSGSSGNNATNSTSGSNTTNSTGNATTPDGYTILSLSQIAQNNQSQNALLYGVNAIVQTVVNQNKAPNTTYSINNIVSASYRNQSSGVSYRFYVNLLNAKYVHIDANITVLYRFSNSSYRLTSYSYHSYNYSRSDLPGSSNSTISNPSNSTSTTGTTSNANSTVVGNTTTNSSNTNSGNTISVANSTNNGTALPSTSNNSGSNVSANSTAIP